MDKISKAQQYMGFLLLRSQMGVDRDEAIKEYLNLTGQIPIEPHPNMDAPAQEIERIDPAPV